MRERRNQVGPRPILVTQIRNVLHDDDRAEELALALPQRHRLQQVDVVAAADVQVNFDTIGIRPFTLRIPQRGPHSQVVRMAAVQVVERAAERIFSFDAKYQGRDLVDVRHDSLGVDQHYPVLETLDDRLGLVLLVDQPIDVELLELFQPLRHPVELLHDDLQLGQWLRAQSLRRAAAEAEAAQPIRKLVERLREGSRQAP